MNHPQPEKWIPYVFNEIPMSERAPLAAHLRDCPDCRGQVERWQCTLGRLDAWKLPDLASSRRTRNPAMRWAAAAAIVLAGFGLAFGLGRMSAPQPDVTQLRA